MTTEPTTIKIWLAVNQDGDFYASSDGPDDATSELLSNYNCEAIRNIAIAVTVDLPTAETVAVAVTVPPPSQTPAQVSVS